MKLSLKRYGNTMKNWEYEIVDCPDPRCNEGYKIGPGGTLLCNTCKGASEINTGFIKINHPSVANLFLNRMVYVKIKRNGIEGEVLCTPAILKAFALGKLEYFKVHKSEVDHLIGWKCDNDEFALHVLQYGMDQDERNKFFDWHKWTWRGMR